MVRIIAVVAFAFLFSSCSNKSDSVLAVFKATEEGFLNSNSVVSNSSTVIYHALDEKLLKPESAQQASVWQPKAMLIKENSAGIIRYLDSLIVELKKGAGLRLENMREVYREDDLEVVSSFFLNKNTGDELYDRLQKFKSDILAVDPELKKEFGDNSIIITYRFEQEQKSQKDFTKTFFDGVPAIAAIAILRKLENNVRVMENKFIEFCHNKLSSTYGDDFGTVFHPMIAINSSYVKVGDEIKITAGIGTFSIVMQPVITISGKNMQPGENGVVTYEFNSPLKAGKYLVPVKIEFTKPDGSKGYITKDIEYTVAE